LYFFFGASGGVNADSSLPKIYRLWLNYYFVGTYLTGQGKTLPAAVYFFITFIDFPGSQSPGFLAAAVV
jgi:hypothetical protein